MLVADIAARLDALTPEQLRGIDAVIADKLPPMPLPHAWKPRPYQQELWDYLDNGGKRAIMIAHRRWGKDDVCLHWTCVAAHQRIANWWHCLPLYTQAKKAIWEAVNPHTGKKRIDEAFPLELRARTDNSAMTIEFKNGSVWRVVGSDDPNSLVGAPPAGIVFSEWAISNPSAWGYLAPILDENDGWAVFITTPRGRNHAYDMWRMANRSKDDWFAARQGVAETGYSLEHVEKQRLEYHSIFGRDAGDALIEQEYFCSFEAAILGAIWGKELQAAEAEGRITAVPADPALKVHTAWDLGVGDRTALWFFQMAGNEPHIIDFYQADGYAVDHYVEVKRQRGYDYGHDFVPHDARARVFTNSDPKGLARTRIEIMRQLGLKPKLVPDHKLEDGISAARITIPLAWFDKDKCAEGLECLRQYRYEWDDEKKVFRTTPLHDWASDGADSFRYLCMAWRDETVRVQPPKPPGRVIQVGFGTTVTLTDLWKMREGSGRGIRV